jgi:hypothetical protein
MLIIEKINKTITLNIEKRFPLFSSLLFKTLLVSITLHAAFFYLFTIQSETVEEDILIMPSLVETEKNEIVPAIAKGTLSFTNNSFEIFLKPIEKLNRIKPSGLSYDVDYIKYINTPSLEIPSFDAIESKLQKQEEIKYLSSLLTLTFFSEPSLKLKSKSKELLLKKIQGVLEGYASYLLLVDTQTGKIINFKLTSDVIDKNNINFDNFINDLSFEYKANIESIKEVFLEMNLMKFQEKESLVIIK